MMYSRRRFGLALPALAGAVSSASAENKALPSAALKFEDFKVKESAHGSSRAVLNGETHSGFAVEMHITELNVGEMPHPPHHHVHEEAMFIQRGILDVTVNGKTTRLTAGSLFFVHSNDEHGVKNPGPEKVQYFVTALGPGQA
jgi:mannose-6-phosphate isomerase-like protein (cupin superfamily)